MVKTHTFPLIAYNFDTLYTLHLTYIRLFQIRWLNIEENVATFGIFKRYFSTIQFKTCLNPSQNNFYVNLVMSLVMTFRKSCYVIVLTNLDEIIF